jgi:hypothetical protein
MIIIIFIPFIIVFPIPIIPFIFILPLKPILLELPPFKTLTNTGTLPIMYKIISRIFDYRFFSNFFSFFVQSTFTDLGEYFSYNANQLSNEIFYYLTGNNLEDYDFMNNDNNDNNNDNDNHHSQDGRTKEMIRDGIETNDSKEDIDKYNKVKDSPKIKGGMEKIKEYTDLCVNMSQKFKLYNSSFAEDVSTDVQNSITPYNKCYIDAIKSYLKSSIN